MGTMVNFGYPKETITEKQAVWGFVWIITMCITHTVSALLMLPVVLLGWNEVGHVGQCLFVIGTLSEVGFDIYDWLRLFLLVFFPSRFSFLGEPVPLLLFVLLAGFHHSTVLTMTLPMNLKYAHLASYHYIAFALLFSAGVCFISGHYKFTVDAKTPRGLFTCKVIVTLQFCMNFIARFFVYFPAAYSGLRTFYDAGDRSYLYGGMLGVMSMGLYNLIVLSDATSAATKWLAKTQKTL